MRETVDIKGLEKIDVLLALYNAAKATGMPVAQLLDNNASARAAQLIAEHQMKFAVIDLGRGSRLLGIDLSTDELDATEYNAANGNDLANITIAKLRTHLKQKEEISRLSLTGTPPMLPSSPVGTPVGSPGSFTLPPPSSDESTSPRLQRMMGSILPGLRPVP